MEVASLVNRAIDYHLATVRSDEGSFYEDGRPIDEALSRAMGEVEQSAFISFVDAPCRSSEDVQAKLRHLLHGTTGERTTHLMCLCVYGDDLEERFMRSLLIEGEA